jgi:hypothetical protein
MVVEVVPVPANATCKPKYEHAIADNGKTNELSLIVRF